jgi:hypothetical protein
MEINRNQSLIDSFNNVKNQQKIYVIIKQAVF